jgi:uncharacterized protein (TIGR03067 family)
MLTSSYLGLALALGAPALKPPTDAALVGEWVVDRRDVGGQKLYVLPVTLEFTFAADGKVVLQRNGKKWATGRYTVDPTRSPAEIEWAMTDANGRDAITGIYKVENDTLTLCTVAPADARPATFEPPAGSRITHWTLKRVAKKD